MADLKNTFDVDLKIKEVASDNVLQDMEKNNQLGPNELIFTKLGTAVPMMPVGSIFVSAIPQTDARVHLLDGSTISQTGVYETFANLIKALVSAGQPITCTQDEFNADVSTYGQCGKFVIDNDNGTIRLPRITEFIASNNGGQTIGLAELDSFKSHKHHFGASAHTGDSGYTHSSGNGSWNFSAMLYGGSDTDYTGDAETKPKNIRYPYYIVLASGYKSSQVVDVDNVINELNNRTLDYVIKSVPTSTGWFVKWASGLKEFWGHTTTASADHTITFPEVFSSLDYGVSVTPLTDNTASDIIAAKVQRSTSNIIVRMRYKSTSGQGNATVNISYWVKGY